MRPWLHRLLWKTRGLHWDYEFLALPREPQLRAWGETFRLIFAGADSESADRKTRVGLLALDGGTVPFVAMVIDDPDRVDASTRTIRHYLVVFGEPTQRRNDLVSSVAENWADLVQRAVREAHAALFDLPKEVVWTWAETHPEQALGAYLLESSQRILDQSEAPWPSGPVSLVGKEVTTMEAIAPPKAPRSPASQARSDLTWPWRLLAVMLAAVAVAGSLRWLLIR